MMTGTHGDLLCNLKVYSQETLPPGGFFLNVGRNVTDGNCPCSGGLSHVSLSVGLGGKARGPQGEADGTGDRQCGVSRVRQQGLGGTGEGSWRAYPTQRGVTVP